MTKIQSESNHIFDHIRSSCRKVAERAKSVQINHSSINSYAASLPLDKVAQPQLDPSCHYLGRREDTVNFILTLDTINFGSGYFPHLRKRPGMSGYFTIASALNDRYAYRGPLSAQQLADVTVEECIRIFDQDPENILARELMQHFSIALNDLGHLILARFNGRFTGLVDLAGSSAERLVKILKNMPYFDDVAAYDGSEVLFYKRAQITAADLALAFGGRDWGYFEDLDQMTIFADNLVPHVLRIDGILIYEESLLAGINEGSLIAAGSSAEVEIRACAVHAVELIKHQLAEAGRMVTSPELDSFLWNRGQQAEYKAVPRHRTRCVFY